MIKVAYITPVFDPNNTYRENVLCEYLEQKCNLDIYTFSKDVYGNEKTSFSHIYSCKGLKFKSFYIYFPIRFLIKKYDYVIVSDLIQGAPIIFLLAKFFSKSKIIIEHEQRNFGFSWKGIILTLILYLPMLITLFRADLVRSPNKFSSRFLSFFPISRDKILELPLATTFDAKIRSHIEKEGRVLFWSGKGFFSKGGSLLLKLVLDIKCCSLIIISEKDLGLETKKIWNLYPLFLRDEYEKIAVRTDLAIFLSPTQSMYDVASLGTKVLVSRNSLPEYVDSISDSFIPVDLECDKFGKVLNNPSNYLKLKVAITESDLSVKKPYQFSPPLLWSLYEQKS